MSDYRYFCDYMDLMAHYIETTPNTDCLSDYYWQITGKCVNIFLKLQFERPSKRGNYTGDRGKKGATVTASHKAVPSFFHPLVKPLSPGVLLCCEDKSVCKLHADIIKESMTHSAAVVERISGITEKPGQRSAEFEDVCVRGQFRAEQGRREPTERLTENSEGFLKTLKAHLEAQENTHAQILAEFKELKEMVVALMSNQTVPIPCPSPKIGLAPPAVEPPSTSAPTNMDSSSQVLNVEVAVPPPIVFEDGPFRVEYSRPYDPADPYYINVPNCSLRGLGGHNLDGECNFKSSKEIYECAMKHFRKYNLRHGHLWRKNMTNAYIRYSNVTGHVKEKMATESMDVDAACDALDKDIRFAIYNTSNKNDPNRKVIGYSFTLMGKAKAAGRNDFGMDLFDKQQFENRAAELIKDCHVKVKALFLKKVIYIVNIIIVIIIIIITVTANPRTFRITIFTITVFNSRKCLFKKIPKPTS
ncbi:hypothetical protein BDR26DRAFT_945480 [Obelidium mucronatum]|nr:hypothetical protein BDR26DRAFT_945480 [Obelidium mucronatum]